MNRITIRPACAGLAFLACAAVQVHAQQRPGDYPRKPIRIVVGIAPAGGLDLMSRVGAQKMGERWNQSVIVDNRPGGGTVIGMDLEALKVKLDREYAELEKVIKTLNLTIN